MGASFYPILPSEVKIYHLIVNGQATLQILRLLKDHFEVGPILRAVGFHLKNLKSAFRDNDACQGLFKVESTHY